MAECPAVNASPLIFLSRAALIHFLQVAAAEIIVPRAVTEEIERRGRNDITVQTINDTPWLIIAPTPTIPASVLAWGLVRSLNYQTCKR